MPCSKYKGKQRRLCYATNEWKDWSKIKKLPKVMTLKEYKEWIKNPLSKQASLKSFFPNGVKRTINILKGNANKGSVSKWKSFGTRHYAQYKKNPTLKRKIALRNWGFKV